MEAHEHDIDTRSRIHASLMCILDSVSRNDSFRSEESFVATECL
jgi:hypothetical protein